MNKLRERLTNLFTQADERQVLRAEIAHYREKVIKLANEGLNDVKAQSKAESNQQKYVFVFEVVVLSPVYEVVEWVSL